MDIKTLADELARDQGTRDPFRIAKQLKYALVNTPLEDIRGFYQYVNRRNIIYVDSSLPKREQLWVCAHEIGHSKLHKGLNRVFMDTYTHMVTTRYEREADKFAVNLLYSDEDLQEMKECSISSIADYLGVSNDLAMYRLKCIN